MCSHTKPVVLVAVLAGLGTWLSGVARVPAESPAPIAAPAPAILGEMLKAHGYRAVPLERRKNSDFLWLTGNLAGQPVTLVVDSAADATTVNTAVAKRLKLRLPVSGDSVYGIDGTKVPRSWAFWPDLRIGDLTIPLPYLGVADVGRGDEGAGPVEMISFDGVLGANTLNHYSAVIDWSAPTLYLLDPEVSQKEIQGEWRGVDMEHHGKRLTGLQAERYKLAINGARARFRVDPTASEIKVAGFQVQVEWGEQDHEFRVELGPCATPKEMGFYASDGYSRKAIYEVKDGKLRIAMPIADGDNFDDRPTSFTPPAGKGFAVFTLERVPGK